MVCGGCGESLAGAPVVSTDSRQVFDLPLISLWITEHRIRHLRCSCGQVSMADVPAGVGAPAQYRPWVRALGVYLLSVQHLPLERTARLLGPSMSAEKEPLLRLRTDLANPNVLSIQDVVAKNGPRAWKTTALITVGDRSTGEIKGPGLLI